MRNTNVVVKNNTVEHLALGGRGWHVVPGVRGYYKEEVLMSTPSSPLQGTSPARGEVNSGFTLIELLVVVLIIGILAAVAVPQYQKAVEKSHVVQPLILLKSMGIQTDIYYQTTGSCPVSFSDLDILPPANWNKNIQAFQSNAYSIQQSNDAWALEINQGAYNNLCQVTLTRLTGPYRGTAWTYIVIDPALKRGHIYCVEIRNRSDYTFNGQKNSYCAGIFGGTHIGGEDVRIYALP